MRNRSPPSSRSATTAETGLSKKDSLYEIGRVSDVLLFGANECLKDDGQIFSCDLTPHGKKRRVYTQRDPLLGVIIAITPFNHPMNQVAHKVVPAIVTNNRMVLKPSEKVPLSAIAARRHPLRSRAAAGDVPGGHRRPAGDRRRADHQRPCRPRHLHRRGGDRQVHRLEGRLPAHGARARRQRPDHRDGRRRRRGGGDRSRSRARTRTPASAAPRSSGCWCTIGGRSLRRAGGRQDQGLELRRPDGRQARHGHRDRRAAARCSRTRSTRRWRAAPSCWPAT